MKPPATRGVQPSTAPSAGGPVLTLAASSRTRARNRWLCLGGEPAGQLQ